MPPAVAPRPLSPPPSLAAQANERSPLARATLLLCFALAVVGVWFRFWRLDHLPGLNGDEAWGGVQAARMAAGEEVPWRTPTGNPLNPFFFLPLAALHALWPASIELLRLPAALSGVLALAVNYLLCRRTFDRRTAAISTLLLAVLPVNIAYSRFGWDASQTLLASVLVIYPALRFAREPARRGPLLWSAIALGGAMLVHPTNIFLTPFLVVAAAVAWRDDMARLAKRPWNVRHLALLLASIAAAAVVAWLGRHWLAVAGGRLLAPHEGAEFARHYMRLFSGATVYQYIAGALRPAAGEFSWMLAAHDLAALAAALFIAGTWWTMLRRKVRRQPLAERADHNGKADVCLAFAGALMVLGFFLVAGPKAIAPHYERYAICLVAPGALLAARAAAWLLVAAKATNAQRRLSAGLACAGGALLASCYLHYFDFMIRTGGASHVAFRTAEVDPKEQALRHILARREGPRPVYIVASSWWSYWPLAYLASGETGVYVITGEGAYEQQDVQQALHAGNLWVVEFTGTAEHREAIEQLTRNGRRAEEWEFAGSDGAAVLTVIEPRR